MDISKYRELVNQVLNLLKEKEQLTEIDRNIKNQKSDCEFENIERFTQ